MQIDLSAIGLFQQYYAGTIDSTRLLEHPAYQAILRHARLFGGGFEASDIDKALRGEESAFPGLTHIHERLPAVLSLAEYLSQVRDDWVATATRELHTLLPDEALDHVVVYPVIGYDIGIGLSGSVVMNLSTNKYLTDPNEFLYYMIHESTHVLFEPYHPFPDFAALTTPQAWVDLLLWATHYEGYATYAPLRLRLERQHTQDSDYVVLMDQDQLTRSIREFGQVIHALENDVTLSADQRLGLIYGPSRIAYRVGCELVRRIRQTYGPQDVTKGAYLGARDFWDKYAHLLDD